MDGSREEAIKSFPSLYMFLTMIRQIRSAPWNDLLFLLPSLSPGHRSLSVLGLAVELVLCVFPKPQLVIIVGNGVCNTLGVMGRLVRLIIVRRSSVLFGLCAKLNSKIGYTHRADLQGRRGGCFPERMSEKVGMVQFKSLEQWLGNWTVLCLHLINKERAGPKSLLS